MKEEIQALIKKYEEIYEDAEEAVRECGCETFYGVINTSSEIIKDLKNLINSENK
jgi:hypothetical protein